MPVTCLCPYDLVRVVGLRTITLTVHSSAKLRTRYILPAFIPAIVLCLLLLLLLLGEGRFGHW